MRLHVRHRTRYGYAPAIPYAIQEVRLTPGPVDGQAVRRWTVRGEGGRILPAVQDGYGNLMHLHSLLKTHGESEILAEGEVVTTDTSGIVRGARETLPAAYYRRVTPSTAADGALSRLAGEVRGHLAENAVAAMHRLMGLIRDRIDFEKGRTDAGTTAAEALASGRGVCQDHAHVLIACARHLGLPARYVSGYLWTGDGTVGEASHAWAELHLSGLGWVGFDAANRVCPTESYVRVAAGLDYGATAPVRGIRRGAAEETLTVEVRVRALG
ncbi:MAG: transglutaminase family protein [Geminicoccaceae bacterium]|nr:transglutaminase family protein [Geminicoccaceae bacterium]